VPITCNLPFKATGEFLGALNYERKPMISIERIKLRKKPPEFPRVNLENV
jgi:hypothetical protein